MPGLKVENVKANPKNVTTGDSLEITATVSNTFDSSGPELEGRVSYRLGSVELAEDNVSIPPDRGEAVKATIPPEDIAKVTGESSFISATIADHNSSDIGPKVTIDPGYTVEKPDPEPDNGDNGDGDDGNVGDDGNGDDSPPSSDFGDDPLGIEWMRENLAILPAIGPLDSFETTIAAVIGLVALAVIL